jgi:26S proteasome regulatory subunit (ATPase 3-interacting protein)
MAPRKPKPDDDAASTTSADTILKPNTSKAKVEKPKTEKSKTVKAKAVKNEKTTTIDDEEKPAKPVKKVVKKVSGDGDNAKEVKSGGKGDKDGGKEKVKPVTGEEAVQLILGYLKAQNRPYSATEISANLHGKVSSLSSMLLFLGVEVEEVRVDRRGTDACQ